MDRRRRGWFFDSVRLSRSGTSLCTLTKDDRETNVESWASNKLPKIRVIR
jgi:hypothetical protein